MNPDRALTIDHTANVKKITIALAEAEGTNFANDHGAHPILSGSERDQATLTHLGDILSSSVSKMHDVVTTQSGQNDGTSKIPSKPANDRFK